MDSEVDCSESCIICFRNNSSYQEITLLEVLARDSESRTYLDKIHYIMNCQITIYECSVICRHCAMDLDNAFSFREKVVDALNYWTKDLEMILKNRNLLDEEIWKEADDNTSERVTEFFKDSSEAMKQEPLSQESDDNVTTPFTSTFMCKICKQIFSTKSELMYHQCRSTITQQKHKVKTKALEVKCSHCEAMFDKKLKLSEHLSKAHPKEKHKLKTELLELICFHCQATFDAKSKLREHLSNVHNCPSKKYICTHCNRSFKQSVRLREHITSHTGEHNFICEICGKTFQIKWSHFKHMRSHAAPPGSKSIKTPFLCTICGKTFPYSNSRQRHMRIHSGERRHQCKLCGRKFATSSHLKVHTLTHTGEKAFHCTICNNSFTLPASLRKHMSRHTRNATSLEQNFIKGGRRVENFGETRKSVVKSEDDGEKYDEENAAVESKCVVESIEMY